MMMELVGSATLKEIVSGYDPESHPIIGPLMEGGPVALALKMETRLGTIDIAGGFDDGVTLANPDLVGRLQGPDVGAVLEAGGSPRVSDGPFDIGIDWRSEVAASRRLRSDADAASRSRESTSRRSSPRSTPARGCGDVVGASQPGDGVQQHDDVVTELDQAAGTLDGELGDGRVVVSRPVEGGGDHLRVHGTVHIGNVFRPLAN